MCGCIFNKIVYNNNIKENCTLKSTQANLESEVEALKTTGIYGSY